MVRSMLYLFLSLVGGFAVGLVISEVLTFITGLFAG